MASLHEILLLIRWSGVQHIFRIVQNTLKREHLNRQYLNKRRRYLDKAPIRPGSLINAEHSIRGAQFEFDHASLEVVFLTPDLVQITWKPGIAPIPYALQDREWPEVCSTLHQTDEGLQLSSSSIQINLQQDGALQFKDHQGVLLRAELPPYYRGKSDSAAWTAQSILNPSECIYGLGEQSEPLNLRNTSHKIWNTDPGGSYGSGYDPLYMPLPVYFSLHPGGSYLLFYENPFQAIISIGTSLLDDPPAELSENTDQFIKADFEGGQLRYYFILGDPRQALERYAELTGFPAIPPRWSLGYHQCRWGYQDQADIRRVAAGFIEYEMPLSAIHLDIDYLDGYRVFTVDKTRFPDLASLAKELNQQGVCLVTIIDPGVKQDPDNYLYQEGLQDDYFCKDASGETAIGMVWPGWSAFPDFTDPKVRLWWSKQYATLLEAGVDGIWHDMNEPSSFAAWGDPTLPLATRHKLEGRGGDHLQAHNLYGLLMNRAAYEGLRKHRPDRRPWILSRSGWVSSERYAWTWTADTESTWDSMWMTIRSILGTGLSGQPYSGPDIGGFRGNPSAELFTRYFQMATFMPFFRTHSAVGSQPREPWVYGEPYTSIIRQHLNLRYQLMPYLYTLAWEAHHKGCPLARPLFWADIQDQCLWEIDDAFLLGDNLLIAPVLEPKANKRLLQLPRGQWISLWDETVYEGPASITLPVSLQQIPVLARAGSIIPMMKDNNLVLHFYRPLNYAYPEGNQPAGQIYTDAGDGYQDWRLDSFHCTHDGNSITITWDNEGTFPFPYQGIEIQLHGFQAKTALLDREQLTISEGHAKIKRFKTLQLFD